MWRSILAWAALIDSAIVLIATVTAFYEYWNGDSIAAIFWILVATFFGRGQTNRFTKR
jgi:hypothetical protein